MSESVEMRSVAIRIAIIGTGDVGTAFAAALKQKGVDVTLVSGRGGTGAREKVERLGLPFCDDFEAAVRAADLVLSAVTGEGSRAVAGRVVDLIRADAIFADLTSSGPDEILKAAASFAASRKTYVDAAIMGAVGLHGQRTPIIAAGPEASRFADIMNGLGFEVTFKAQSRPGDASALKLIRSVFAKGLDMLVVEAMLAARAFGLEEDLLEQLGDFDRSTMREIVDMYLRTHTVHAARRLHEMQETEAQLASSGLPSFGTHAAVERYSRTVELLERFPPGPEIRDDASANLDWMLNAERRSRIPGS